MLSNKALRLHRHARGFSLIELGIVIAVIAVLAAVVIFGRGFIVAGRVSKTVEALDTIRKAGAAYAGLQGGTVAASLGNGITPLGNRSLLPVKVAPWTVAGGTGNAFTIDDIRFGPSAGFNIVAIKVSAPANEQLQDIWNSLKDDQNLYKAAVTVGTALTCPTVVPSGVAVSAVYCFKL